MKHAYGRPSIRSTPSENGTSIAWWAGIPLLVMLALKAILDVTNGESISGTLGLCIVFLVLYVLSVGIGWVIARFSGDRRLVTSITFLSISSVVSLAMIASGVVPLTPGLMSDAQANRAFREFERSLKDVAKTLQTDNPNFLEQNRAIGRASLKLFKDLEPIPGPTGRIGAHMTVLGTELLSIKEPMLVTTDTFIRSGGLDPVSLKSQKVCQERMMQLVAMRSTAQVFYQSVQRLSGSLRERLEAEALDTPDTRKFLRAFERQMNSNMDLAEVELRFINAAFDYIKVLHDYAGTWSVEPDGLVAFTIEAPIRPFSDAHARVLQAARDEQAWIETWLSSLK